jgi:YaiO family outer membrane protein
MTSAEKPSRDREGVDPFNCSAPSRSRLGFLRSQRRVNNALEFILKTNVQCFILILLFSLPGLLHASPKQVLLKKIDSELTLKNTHAAQLLLNQALKSYPNDPDVLAKQAKYFFTLRQYARAGDLSKQILEKTPKHPDATSIKSDIYEINPHLLHGLNAVGVNSEIDYVSDLKSIWQYTTLNYNRDMTWGVASLSLNNTSRFGETGNQGAIALYPIVNNQLYFRVNAAYANKPVLFPTYSGGGEVYYSGFKPAELSIGASHYSIVRNIAFSQFTGSISKEIGPYWIGFRPNYYLPARGRKSALYTGTLIRYFGPLDTYAKVTVGSGTTPDLANLTTVDFIVIKNTFVVGVIQIPLLDHRLLLSLGGDYQHWVFPSGKVRNISGGIIGLAYRFEDPK